MRASTSLIRLIIQRVLAVTLLYLAVMSFVLYRELDLTLILLRDKILTEHAMEIGSYLEKDDKQNLILDMPLAAIKLYASAGSHYQYTVLDKAGKILFHSPVFPQQSFLGKWPAEHSFRSFETRDATGRLFLGKGTTYDFEGSLYLIEVLRDKEVADEFSNTLIRVFLSNIGLTAFPLMLLLIGVLVFAIRHSLSPVVRVAHQAEGISFATPGVRLGDTDLPQEIYPLAASVNRALERMEQGIVLQKEFTAHAAHELRTPLAILRSHVDLLKDREVAVTLQHDLDTMNRLVSQLLAAARLEFPDGLPMERLNLVAIVREVCADIWPLMINGVLQMEVSGIDAPVWVQGHHDSIYGSLRNILENALHYAPPGTSILVDVAGGRISVTDHGPGIPDSAKEKIFERFWRLDQRNKSGSGIGLYIVKRTMELHGGRVSVENATNSGSIFILIFPEAASAI